MSEKNVVVTAAVESTPVSYIAEAQTCVEEVRAMRERIPYFAIPDSSDAAQRLSSAASVPTDFVELTAMAVTNQKTLSRTESTTAAQIRDLMQYATAYSPVADELEALAQFIRHSVRVAKNKAGAEALTIYALAQRLAKRPESAELAPHVADMRRALGRGRKLSAETVARRAAKKAKASGTTAPGSAPASDGTTKAA
jgi:hypothetical protein